MIESIMVKEKSGIESTRGKPFWGLIAAAWIWLFGFAAWFHSFGLGDNGVLPRRELWNSIAFDLLDLIDPPVDKAAPPWSYLYLLQRLPFFFVAAVLWTAAWGLGSSILRGLSVRLAGAERIFFATCLGLSGISLAMLLLGVCGWMSQPLMIVALAICIAAGVITRFGLFPSRIQNHAVEAPVSPAMALRSRLLAGIVIATIIPFFVAQQLGAMTPQNDFDVVEYHLGGPKEWYQRGRIERLPHNVYTSFPFLTEMLILTGMVTYGGWQWGALAGQAAIAGFAPLTAVGLFAAGRRFFSTEVGWIAVLVYMTSPWTYRISIIAYAEGGLACFLFAALYAFLLYREQRMLSDHGDKRSLSGTATLTGLMCGSAMACKYTGLVSVVCPIALFMIWITWSQATGNRIRQIALIGILFSIGVLCTVGPWLLKNTIETGNPVYPLAVRIFGGFDRDEALDAKFRKAHANPYQSLSQQFEGLPVMLTDVMANNNWHSPLMFGLAPLSLLACLRRRRSDPVETAPRQFDPGAIGLVWLFVAWQFIVYWAITHHIDRFYVPMFSAVALLAGVGVMWSESILAKWSAMLGGKIWSVGVTGLFVASILYNFEVIKWLGGWNAGRIHLEAALERKTIGDWFPRIGWINEQFESGRFPANTKVLCVGEAALFHARFPYMYNTVFDHSLFEELCAEPGADGHRLKSAEQILSEFRRLGITHIDVNWSEILRYRDPTSYGYTDFVHPDRFAELQKMGVLGPQILPQEYTRSRLEPKLRDRLQTWAPSLIVPSRSSKEDQFYTSAQLFPVQTQDRATK